jgi:hypothetical protein
MGGSAIPWELPSCSCGFAIGGARLGFRRADAACDQGSKFASSSLGFGGGWLGGDEVLLRACDHGSKFGSSLLDFGGGRLGRSTGGEEMLLEASMSLGVEDAAGSAASMANPRKTKIQRVTGYRSCMN